MSRINLAKSLKGIFVVWVTVITFRYGAATLQSVRSPISPGADIEWLAVWVIAVIVMAVLAAGFRYSLVITAVGLVCACFAITILSGTLTAGAATLWIFLLAYGCGASILRFANVEMNDPWESISLAIPLGLIVVALGGFVLSAAHILTPAAVWVLLIFLTVPLVRGVTVPVHIFSEKRWLIPMEISFPLLTTAPIVLFNFTWAVAPEIQYDANNYHLAVPRIYLSNAGFVNLPYFFHSYFFRFVEMLFTLGLAIQGPATGKLMSFVFGLVATLSVFALGKLLFDARTGAWAAALFYTTPIVSWLGSTASNDLSVGMFITAALIAFLKFRENPNCAGWFYAAALLSGAAIATKIDGAFGLIPLLACLFWQTRKSKAVVICTLLLLIVVLPWYATTFYWTGNPVFPLLNGVFKSPLWAIENRVMNARDFGLGTGPGSLARLPFRLIFDTSRFGEAAPRGTAGVALLLAFPFSAVLLRDRKNGTALLIATSLVYTLLWAYSFQYLRYYGQILPIICVLAAGTMMYFRVTVWMALVLVLQFATAPLQYWNIPERFPTAVALGRETREQFLQRTLSPYSAVQYLNTVTKPGDRVLGIETDNVRFYLKAPLDTLVESTLGEVLVKARSMPADKQLADILRQSGFVYILTSRSALIMPEQWYPYLQADFLNRFAEMEFRDSNVSVYRLKF